MPDPTQKKPILLIPVRADAGELAAAEKPLPAVLQAASRGAGGGHGPIPIAAPHDPLYPALLRDAGSALARVGAPGGLFEDRNRIAGGIRRGRRRRVRAVI